MILVDFMGKNVNNLKGIPICMERYQGLSARARPIFGDALSAFESYSAETVTSDFGLHSRCHSTPAFPLSENRVFTTVNGSIT